VFDLKRRTVTLANSGLPYPIRAHRDTVGEIELPGVPLGSFQGVTYDELSYPLEPGDMFVFSSDGVNEAMNSRSEEFTAARAMEVVRATRHQSAQEITDAMLAAVDAHRDGFPPNDDTTIVVLKVNDDKGTRS
jgi:sigma-B regulation protein RsbU (phosphoserine phosphatase)